MSIDVDFHRNVSDQAIWQQFRQAMPVAQKWAYFDHAAVAPIPQRAFDRINTWNQQALYEGDAVWPRWSAQYEQTRSLSARLINAQLDEIGLVPNTSFGINLVSEGFPWQAGDNVVLPGGEFPSNVYPWMHLRDRGVEVRIVPLDGMRVCPNRIAEACDARTRIVSASWVGFASGYRLDPYELGRVAHDRGALFFLDAIQGLGVFPLDVSGGEIDFLAADGHKWLLGPEGAGIFYCRRDRLPQLRAINVGWNSVAQGNDYNRIELNLKTTAARYESGSQNIVGFIGLLGSLETLLEHGLAHNSDRLGQRVIQVTDLLVHELQRIGASVFSDRSSDAVKSGIVSFELPGCDSLAAKSALYELGNIVSFRGGRLRAAAHAYNDESDIEKLIAGCQHIIGKR
jgi:selenocysteine lyase/cysteine desulfurase